MTENEKYSKTLKIGKVETFEWTYEDKVWNPEINKFQMIKKNIEGLEAIYINPKWQKSKVGDFLTFDKKKGKKKSKKEKYQIINS